MSLINDALKKAQKAPSSPPPSGVKPLQPVLGSAESAARPAWLLPSIVVALVILLAAAAIIFIGWETQKRSGPITAPEAHADPLPSPVAGVTRTAVAPTPAPAVVPPPAPVPPPVPATATPTPMASSPPPPATINPPKAPPIPKLQGIFYSSAAPSAIVDGRTVQPGDQIHQYRVKLITKNSVTLVGPDDKELQLDIEK